VVVLIASALAGFLWDVEGSRATFMTGAAFTTLAMLLFPFAKIREP
jgi:hypothetical protein